MKRIGRTMVLLTIMLLTVAAAPVWAEDEKLPDQFMVRLGGYHARNANTIIRLDANDLPVGAYVDFNETLGGDSSTTVARMDGLYRIKPQHGVGISWYSLKFTGSRVLGRDITWGDLTYPLSTQVNSEIKFDIYKANYQYSVYHNAEAEIGALVGFHIMKTVVSIDAVGINQSRNQAITAPLPVLGLYADYNFTPRLNAFYNYQVFSINYEDKVKGNLQDFLFGIEYRLIKNVALGAAYNRFAASLDMKGTDVTLHLNTGWNGLMLYGTVYF